MEGEIIKNYTTTYKELKRGTRAKQKYMSWRFIGKVLGNVFAYVLVLGIAFVIVYPLFRRIGNAFKPTEDFYDTSVVYFPRNPTFEVVKRAIAQLDLKHAGINSFLLALFVGLSQTAVATLVGYGFARFKFRGSKILFFCVLLTLIIPPQTIMIPLYLRFCYFDILGIFKALTGNSLKLINTYWCQILLSLTGIGWKNGLYIYMMRSYYRGIPKELEEAAYIDGAKTFRAFFEIMIPSAVPMMMTIFLFSFSWQWTDIFYSSKFYSDTGSTLLTLKINAYSYTSNPLMEFNVKNTATLIILLPLILLFIVTQKFFVEGIERSGLTGM